MNEKLEILCFGMVEDIVGQKRTQLDFNHGLRVSDLKSQMEQLFPALRATSYKVALNEQICEENQEIQANDILALLPPFAGG